MDLDVLEVAGHAGSWCERDYTACGRACCCKCKWEVGMLWQVQVGGLRCRQGNLGGLLSSGPCMGVSRRAAAVLALHWSRGRKVATHGKRLGDMAVGGPNLAKI